MAKKKSEYACKCFKITKKEMKQEIKNGVSSFKELQQSTKIGSKCSSCKKKNKKRFDKYTVKIQEKMETSA
jgi:bacterioferritin-associated ferredoxin